MRDGGVRALRRTWCFHLPSSLSRTLEECDWRGLCVGGWNVMVWVVCGWVKCDGVGCVWVES